MIDFTLNRAYFYNGKKPYSVIIENGYLLTAIVATTKTTNTIARIMVIQNKVFSIPRRALKTLPALCPVKPPRPTPLFCKTILAINAKDVIINAI